MKSIGIDHMDIRVQFNNDVEYLRSPVLIYTQTFNNLLCLNRDEWACFVVPDTEYTDGASWNPLVTFLLWMEKRSKKVRLAALGHDHLYRMAGRTIVFYRFDKENRKISTPLGKYKINRSLSDEFIRDKCKHLGANLYRRDMIHTGLHLAGWIAWNKYYKVNTKKNVQQ